MQTLITESKTHSKLRKYSRQINYCHIATSVNNIKAKFILELATYDRKSTETTKGYIVYKNRNHYNSHVLAHTIPSAPFVAAKI